jgi:putative redox protein
MPNAVARRRQGYEHELEIREHRLTADEPEDKGGGDAGPKPTELLAAALASCTAITLEMYADRKEWELGQLEVAVEFTEGGPDAPAAFRVEIKVPAELSDEQRERLLVIASKCPVHRTLAAQDVKIEDDLQMVAS